MLEKVLRLLRLPLFILGLILLFIVERYLAAESYHLVIRLLSIGLIFLAVFSGFLLSLFARRKGLSGEQQSWLMIAAYMTAIFVGALLYLLYLKLLGPSGMPENLGLKSLFAGSLLMIILSFFSGIGLELAHKGSGFGSLAEPARVCRAGMNWLFVGVILVFVVCINYFSSKKDVVRDWSYLKTTSPSESTKGMLSTLSKDMQVAIFYPKDNEVQEHVSEYFDALSRFEEHLKVTYYDKDINPTESEKFRVSKNGQVVLEMADKHERIDIGLSLSAARSQLKKLDQGFQKAFLSLTAAKKVIYFTRNHGEMSWFGNDRDPLRSIKLLETFLRQQNYLIQFFGLAEGSSTDVPDDASAVVIAGAQRSFLEPEVAAIKRYLQKGGKIFILFDKPVESEKTPTISNKNDDPLMKYLGSVGINYKTTNLANDRNYVSNTRSPIDHWFLFSNSFTSHESVASLSKHEERIAVLFYQTGYLELPEKAGDLKINETIRALSNTFNDENKNFTFDEKTEARKTYTLAIAAALPLSSEQKIEATNQHKDEKSQGTKEARIIAVADANTISDALIQNPGNLLFLADSFKWLVGDTQALGDIASEEDVKIQHTRKEDIVWFHGSVIVVPLLVLLAGFLATRRRKVKS